MPLNLILVALKNYGIYEEQYLTNFLGTDFLRIKLNVKNELGIENNNCTFFQSLITDKNLEN